VVGLPTTAARLPSGRRPVGGREIGAASGCGYGAVDIIPRYTLAAGSGALCKTVVVQHNPGTVVDIQENRGGIGLTPVMLSKQDPVPSRRLPSFAAAYSDEFEAVVAFTRSGTVRTAIAVALATPSLIQGWLSVRARSAARRRDLSNRTWVPGNPTQVSCPDQLHRR
jgi:hypothetical protein